MLTGRTGPWLALIGLAGAVGLVANSMSWGWGEVDVIEGVGPDGPRSPGHDTVGSNFDPYRYRPLYPRPGCCYVSYWDSRDALSYDRDGSADTGHYVYRKVCDIYDDDGILYVFAHSVAQEGFEEVPLDDTGGLATEAVDLRGTEGTGDGGALAPPPDDEEEDGDSPSPGGDEGSGPPEQDDEAASAANDDEYAAGPPNSHEIDVPPYVFAAIRQDLTQWQAHALADLMGLNLDDENLKKAVATLAVVSEGDALPPPAQWLGDFFDPTYNENVIVLDERFVIGGETPESPDGAVITIDDIRTVPAAAAPDGTPGAIDPQTLHPEAVH